jgi:hypothetical protein
MSRREKVYAACRPHGSRADSCQLGTSRCRGGARQFVTARADARSDSDVKSHSSIDRSLIVFCSPRGTKEPDCSFALRRKQPKQLRTDAEVRDFLQYRLGTGINELAGSLLIFKSDPVDSSALQTIWLDKLLRTGSLAIQISPRPFPGQSWEGLSRRSGFVLQVLLLGFLPGFGPPS